VIRPALAFPKAWPATYIALAVLLEAVWPMMPVVDGAAWSLEQRVNHTAIVLLSVRAKPSLEINKGNLVR
jgi:hypothetical protein